MEGGDGGSAAKGRAEIDSRSPFKSVREAVSLFGQTLSFTASDLHTAKLKQCIREPDRSNLEGNVVSELEGVKRNLERTAEETKSMANQMTRLKEELKKTKEELQQLKDLQESKMRLTKMMEDLLDIEDLILPRRVDGKHDQCSSTFREKKNKLFGISRRILLNKRKSKFYQSCSQPGNSN